MVNAYDETYESESPVTLYITFGVQYGDPGNPWGKEVHPSGPLVHPDGWWEVRGLPYAQARGLAWCLTGGKFAFDYIEQPPVEDFPRGCIYVIEARVPEEESRG